MALHEYMHDWIVFSVAFGGKDCQIAAISAGYANIQTR